VAVACSALPPKRIALAMLTATDVTVGVGAVGVLGLLPLHAARVRTKAKQMRIRRAISLTSL
jgi:hypothetical protein